MKQPTLQAGRLPTGLRDTLSHLDSVHFSSESLQQPMEQETKT